MKQNPNEFKTANVVSLSATHLLHDTFSSFFAPLLPLLSEKLGFTYAMAGVLATVQKLPSLLNPLIGLIA
ncbi:MAG: MFS transporter, partial [Verrucomicrobia bacterium]|nr:MFS transporter [Verrucomicrobiota bacterium]